MTTQPTSSPTKPGTEHPHRYTAALAGSIETRWQKLWDEEQIFRALNPDDPDFDDQPKFYCLDMFPYPSGKGLHIGHGSNYVPTDVVSRFKRHQGFNVMHPTGWDAFGLPAEQYAVQTNVHPVITTRKAIDTFRRQMKRYGFSYDWSREVATIDPDYYKWTQWIWLKAYHAWFDPRVSKARPIKEMIRDLESGHLYVSASGDVVHVAGLASDFASLTGGPPGYSKWHELSPEEQREVMDNHRLAYLDEQTVNWCPKLGTALANEEVIDGRSERGSFQVYRKPLRQWMFRITAYAQRLLDDLALLDWPESTRTMQTEWIGRSEGAEIEFPIAEVPRRSASRAPADDLAAVEELDLTDQYRLEVAHFVPRDPFPTGEPIPNDLQYERRNLPHITLQDATYFVTWRCRSSLTLNESERATVLSALQHWHGQRCRVFAAVVMPDHVHWLVQPFTQWNLSEIVESVKHFAAAQINRGRGTRGTCFDPERFDHVVRDELWLSKFLFYTVLNPVRAGLVSRASDYGTCFVGSDVSAPDGSPAIEFIDRTYERMRYDLPHDAERRGTTDIRVFTTRPDTLFGATYMVLAPEHPLVDDVLANPLPDTNVQKLRGYVETARNRSDIDRQAEAKQKTGVFTGAYAINPATNQPIPIWVADYVLMGYGHGAIMAVPGHDERDFEFARAFNLPIVRVVRVENESADAPLEEAFADDGLACNSSNEEVSLDDLPTHQAKQRIIDWLEKKNLGSREINYRLRDWLFSRQRYWGEPFPIVFDEQGNHYPVDEKHLPVVLPDIQDFHPIESAEPTPLLAKATDWVNTTAGRAGVSPDLLDPNTPVRRETNTMPGWAGSCWYFLRYCSPRYKDRFVERSAERYWMGAKRQADLASPAGGVDLYIGGAEHAVLHLLYARFWHKMLYDLGEVSTPEPFAKLFHQGMLVSYAYQREDKTLVPIDEVEERAPGSGEFIEKATGKPVIQVTAKMSKSLKNMINPDEVIAEYGADTFRLYTLYMGPLEVMKPWNPRDISGCYRFLQRAWRLMIDEQTGELKIVDRADDAIERQLNRTIDKVADDIERFAFNTAIAAMIELVNAATSSSGLSRDQIERFAIVLEPFAPHVAEEIWSKLGHASSIAHAPWPEVDPAMLVDEEIEIPVQILGKVRGRITVSADADEKAIKSAALADEKIASQLEGKTVRKVIVVQGRIVNIVAN